jgi:hypothetical protein
MDDERKRDVLSDLGVSVYFKPAVAQMAFASEGVYGGGIVVSNLLFLCVVADPHADMIVACAACVCSG